MHPLIKVEHIFKTYNSGEREIRAIDDVSLNIYEGEFVAIIGKSGSGKSTLMNILGVLDIPSRGKYFLDSKDVSSMKDNELSNIRNHKIGFIFQGFNLISGLSAIENVELPLIYRKTPHYKRRELALDSLRQVGLEKRLDHKPSQMSGGQQQRVAIARALAAEPSIILADEPTGNLDSKSGDDIINILKEINQKGKTVILITHDDKIADMAKRKITIKDGKVVNDIFIDKGKTLLA
mgnify:FL=1